MTGLEQVQKKDSLDMKKHSLKDFTIHMYPMYVILAFCNKQVATLNLCAYSWHCTAAVVGMTQNNDKYL